MRTSQALECSSGVIEHHSLMTDGTRKGADEEEVKAIIFLKRPGWKWGRRSRGAS